MTIKKYLINDLNELITYLRNNNINAKLVFKVNLPLRQYIVYLDASEEIHNNLSQKYKLID